MNQSPAPIAPATRTLKTLSAAARLLLWVVLSVWVVVALSWGTLHGIIVPRISEWRPELERWASASVGVAVTLGDIRAESRRSEQGWWPALVPAIELHDVRLFDPAGREALHLPLVRTSMSVRSLWRLGFEQVVIERPVLDVRRTVDGRLEVAGLDLGLATGESTGLDWLLAQSEWVVQGGTVRWLDEQRARPALALQAVDLVLRNGARTHQLRLDATPPPQWGGRFNLRARLREPLLDLHRSQAPGEMPWQRWDGSLFADFPQVDVAQLRHHLDLAEWGLDVREGQGALRLWSSLKRGQATSLTADLALQDVQAQLGPELPPLQLSVLNGRIAAERAADGFSLSTQDLTFRTSEGLVWPAAQLRLEHSQTSGQASRLALKADRVDLATLSALGARLPLPEPAHAWLATLQPSGRVMGLLASWQGPSAAPVGAAPLLGMAWPDWSQGRYQVSARVSGLSLAARPSQALAASGTHFRPGRPGLSGAQLEFELNNEGGRARIEIAQGSIDLPGVFETARLPLDRFEADARWRLQGERIEAQLERVLMSNADAQGKASVRWHTGEAAGPGRFPGVLDLSASLTRAQASRVHRYLPLAVSDTARHYVRDALGGRGAQRVDFRIRGALDQMPLDAPGATGDFRITAQLQNVDVAYVPSRLQAPGALAWPALRGVSGELVLDRGSLQLSRLQAGVEGAPGVRLSQASVQIDDLMHSPTLVAQAQVQGPATEVLGFVRNSPLNSMTAEVLSRARMGGAAQLQFGLNLPLMQLDKSRVSGSVLFNGNDVQITPDSPLLARASGTLNFSESGFHVVGAQARLYGGPVRFDGSWRNEPGSQPQILFRGQGTASAEGLRDSAPGFVSRLFQRAQGSAAYTAQLGFRGGVPELQVSSNLQGMAIELPAPLGKSAESSLALRFDQAALSVVNGQARSDRLALQLGSGLTPQVDLQYERDITGPEPKVLRGSWAVGLGASESAPLPASGVLANLRLGEVDLDAWERVFAATTGVGVRATASPTPRPGPASSTSLSYLPSSFALRAERLQLGGRSFHQLVAGGSRQGSLWRANLEAEELNGYVEYRPEGGGSAGSVFARLARLNLEPTAAQEVEQLLQQPSSVPALDITVDELSLAGRRLGRVEVDASNQPQAGRASEWRLNRLRLSVPEARLSASGHWAARPGRAPAAARWAQMNFRLDIDDVGQLLDRFGRPGVVRAGKGQIDGQLAWAGSPLSIDYPSLNGQVQMDIERGQFLQVEPGAAKLLGVLSLQALPRRLVLDFRDVFSEGFAFDFLRGHASIQQGVMSSNNLQMKGINAAVLMEGTADLAREQQELKVVVPEVNAGTASLIATAINPAVGLGTFLAQFLLRQPLQMAATKEFRITGGWADPQVERVERSANAPAAPARAPMQ